jgi:hypothetical protein
MKKNKVTANCMTIEENKPASPPLYDDSGCGKHMFHTLDWFTQGNPQQSHEQYCVMVANGNRTSSKAEGKIDIQGSYIIDNESYIPGLTQSLVAVSGLNDHGYDVTFKEKTGEVTLTKGTETWIIGQNEYDGNEYKL